MSAIDLVQDPRAAAPAPDLPTYTIDAASSPLRATLGEVWDYRAVLLAFALRSVKVKYAQAAIGVGWVIIQPLFTALILTVVFGRLAKVSSEGAPFLAFAMCGMVAWSFFSTGLTVATGSIVDDQVLLRKVYFPRLVLPVAAVLAATLDAVPAVAVMLVVALLSGVGPAVAWVLIPVPMAIVGLGALAFGLGPAALNVYYRDFRYILPFVIQLGLFASPVAYSLNVIPAPWRDFYAILSPPAGAIESLRDIVLRGHVPPLQYLLGPLLGILVVGLLSVRVFARMERSFADRV